MTKTEENIAWCCGARSDVYDTRLVGQSVKRRRRCSKCGARWSTLEVFASSLPVADKELKHDRA